MSLHQKACHRVLHTLDILEAIFGMFNPTIAEDRAACAHASLVSRAFTESASRVLWRSVSSLRGLWNIATSTLCDAHSGSPIYYILASQYPIDAADWERFLVCAARVHVVQRVWEYDVDIIRAFLKRNDGVTFLPSLRNISWTQYEGCGTLLTSLMPQSLDKLSLAPSGSKYHELEPIFPLLSQSSPFLRTIIIHKSPCDVAVLLAHIAGLKNLHQLIFQSSDDYLTPSSMQYLATSFPIEELSITIDEFVDPNPVIEFPYLRGFDCIGTHDHLLHFVSSLLAPRLEYMSLAVSDGEGQLSIPDLRRFYEVIASLPLASSLKSIDVKAERPDSTGAYSTGLYPEETLCTFLRPCLELKQLTELSICFHHPHMIVTYNDDDMLIIVQALPQLETFRFHSTGPSRPGKRRSSFSPQALLHVARYATHLKILEMSLFVPHPVVIPQAQPTPSHPLRLLEMQESETCMRGLTSLVKFLDLLFPNIDIEEQVRYAESNDRLLFAGWQMVWPRVKAMRDYRRVHAADAL